MNLKQSTYRRDLTFTLRNYLCDMGKEHVTTTILRGLKRPQKHIPSMFFYDGIGSKLFEEITRLPEYYPTRTEKQLLRQLARVLCDDLSRHNIVEIGSGDCSKISILLGAMPPERWRTLRYTPVDVSQDAIQESADHLQRQFPGLRIEGIVADFTRHLHLIPNGGKRFFCFLGSTLGNLSVKEAEQFFLDLGSIMFRGDSLLLGVDMIKPFHVLEKAYNDTRGVTADFNRNILKVVNRLIGTDFDPQAYVHRAFYNQGKNRIEMHLEAMKDMEVSCPAIPLQIMIRKGETIHTENSHKYTHDHVRDLAERGGLKIEKSLTDENRWFSLIHLSRA